ncbi:MAG: GNAT family N-acetyltransferase [Xanthobacteraceae bacterium]|nr:GNAT family N-acetyltransferase [Xanthobacteraceae bacterium]
MPLQLAKRSDVPAIMRLLAQDQISTVRDDPDGDMAPYLAAFDAIAAEPNDALYVWEQDGAVVGCLQLTFLPGLLLKGGWRAQIEGVRVDSRMRRHRIGEQMIMAAVALARDKGCRLVQLMTNKDRRDAQRFYRRLGFVASHEGMKLAL